MPLHQLNLGEYLTANLAFGSATSLTTATAKTVVSLPLTAGDWNVWGSVGYTGNAATVVQIMRAMISATDNTANTTLGFYSLTVPGGSAGAAVFAQDNPVIPIAPARIVLTAPTTYYLVAQAFFTTNTCSAFGIIQARRVKN